MIANKLFFGIFILLLISCNSRQKGINKLAGPFKYTAYSWNNTADSFGIHLLHYLEITPERSYKLVLRANGGSARYYYGYIDNTLLTDLIAFTSVSPFKSKYLVNDSVTYTGSNYLFDYVSEQGDVTITFMPALAPEAVKNIRSRLDSLINSPNKKQSAPFGINDYLKRIIKEKSSFKHDSTLNKQ